jgi:ACS family hexuronate transporter-like MFS transporter
MALAYSGGSLGAIVTPFIVTPIALNFGWRAAFWFTGLAGLVWIVVWLLHRAGSAVPVHIRRTSGEPLPSLRERPFWALVMAYALGAAPIAFGVYAAPIYLSRALGLSQAAIGKLLFIPPLGWEIGYFFWAWVADRFAPGEVRPVRFYVALMLFSLPLAAMTAAASLAFTMLLFFWSMFVAAGFIVFALRYGTLVYPARHTGLIAGIAAGSWSALVAVIMPFVGRLLDEERYGVAFTFAAALPVLGFAGWYVCSRPVTGVSPAAQA